MDAQMPPDLPPVAKLAWIHERMAGVTEEEVLAALKADARDDCVDESAVEAALTFLEEQAQRNGSVSTETH